MRSPGPARPAKSSRPVPTGPAAKTAVPGVGEPIPMKNVARYWIMTILVCAGFAVATGPEAALAQAGSAGGSIGNDEKSLSGPRERAVEPEPSSRRSKPAADQGRPASRRSGGAGGGGGSFDGAWTFVGASTNCQGTGAISAVISGGRVMGQGTSGSVSPSGAYHAVTAVGGGIQLTANGRLSGKGGRGTYMRTDGCRGNWTAVRQ